MDRRTFLGGCAGTVAAAAWPVKCANAAAADWRLGWKSMNVDRLDPAELSVEGRWPNGLRGTLFRNGPARTERAGVRYRHLFDGDGMIQRYDFMGDAPVHSARFVQTRKYIREQEAGRFLYSGAGTHLPNAEPSGNNDSGNAANTALLPWDDELLALWEGGSAYRVDPLTLDTLGRKDWRDDLKHMPFSAHPLVEADGSMWNFGSAPYGGRNGLLFVYRISPRDGVTAVEAVHPPAASYLHSFAMSERYLVFYLGAHHFERGRGETFVDGFAWSAASGSRILLIDKNDLTSQRYFEAPAGFTFHNVHAFESGSEVVLQLCLYPNADVMHSGMIELRAPVATAAYPSYARARFATVRMSLATGRVAVEQSDTLLEFPSTDVRGASDAASVFGVTHRPGRAPTYANALVRLQSDGREVARFDFEDGHMVEEPLFVPNDSDGWLVGTFLDLGRRQSGAYAFDAGRLDAGPLAMARMSRTVPLGFHGCYVPA